MSDQPEKDTVIRAVNCPSCGAPVEWLPEMQEITCKFCGSVITNKDVQLVQAKLNEQTVDIYKADIDQLDELKSHIDKAKDWQRRVAAHKLLLEELGDKYEEFISQKQIRLSGNNGKEYVITTTGRIFRYNDGKQEKEGQMIRQGYPSEDALVAAIKFVKFNANALDAKWGCGRIYLKGE